MTDEPGSLKKATAHTLKWNSIDRFSSQILYAITGIVLANVLPKEDFGLVGAILIFQAFGILFVDSGFGAALLQKKQPDNRDYSTVFWFNLATSLLIYVILFFCAPLIALCFQNNQALIPLSRVMFLSFILNALGIVQTNRLMKEMNVKQIAIANLAGLIISGALGITLALWGAGAWALVWQTLVLAAFKSSWLWFTSDWRPDPVFSRDSLRQIWRVGLGVFSTSMLNTIFLNIYSFIIGAFDSLLALGIYTQADKWSKMGSASLSQIVTATFVPLLSRYQDDSTRFHAVMTRVAGITSFLTLPFMCGLAVMASPIFHTLFGNKWDEAIPLFRILMIRGILVVFISLCTNYILSLGYAKTLVKVEIIKDLATLAAIAATLPLGSVEALVWGQLGASAITYIYILMRVSKVTGTSALSLTMSMWRYLLPVAPALVAAWLTGLPALPAPLTLIMQFMAGAGVYLAVLIVTSDGITREAIRYVFARFHRKKS